MSPPRPAVIAILCVGSLAVVGVGGIVAYEMMRPGAVDPSSVDPAGGPGTAVPGDTRARPPGGVVPRGSIAEIDARWPGFVAWTVAHGAEARTLFEANGNKACPNPGEAKGVPSCTFKRPLFSSELDRAPLFPR